MTNDEIPNDERMTKPEIRKGFDTVIGPQKSARQLDSSFVIRISDFGFRISFVIGYFVIRH